MATKKPSPPPAAPAAPAAPATPAARPPQRRGSSRLPAEVQRRSALPPVRVTTAEHDEVRAMAKTMGVPMGELIRRAVLGRKVQGVPAVNRELWARLAPLIANLNHYIRQLRQGKTTGVPPEMVEQLRTDVDDLREYLLGRDPKELLGDAAPAPQPAPARKTRPAARAAAPSATTATAATAAAPTAADAAARRDRRLAAAAAKLKKAAGSKSKAGAAKSKAAAAKRPGRP